MRKLFFASALVAGMGMLGSCSNDDVAVTNGTPGVGNGNGLVPVELARYRRRHRRRRSQ